MLNYTCYITPCYEQVLCINIKVLYNTLLCNRCFERLLYSFPGVLHDITDWVHMGTLGARDGELATT
jgi:hypothetical protein